MPDEFYLDTVGPAGLVSLNLNDALPWEVKRPIKLSRIGANGQAQETFVLVGTGTTDDLDDDVTELERTLAIGALWALEDSPYGVYLRYRPEGRALHRWARVVSGGVDKSNWSDLARASRHPEVTLRIVHEEPELDQAITLKNLVKNPSFEYDTNGDNVANNWTLLGVGTTSGINSSHVLHGRYSQGVQNLAPDTAGLQSDAITVTANTAYELCVSMYSAAADYGVRVSLWNAVGPILIDSFLAKSTIPGDWNPWRKVITTPAGCTSVYITIVDEHHGPGGWFFLDCVYLGVKNIHHGVDYNHGMWADYNVIANQDDWEWDDANGAPYGYGAHQNSTNRETLDLHNCPGSLPPRLRMNAYQAAATYLHPRLGLLSHPRADETFLSFQAESGADNANTTLRTIAGASGPAANNCRQLSLTAAPAWFVAFNITDAQALLLAGKRVRAFARMANVASPGADYTVQWGLASLGDSPSEYYDATLHNHASLDWSWYAGPEFYFPLAPSLSLPGGNESVYQAYLYIWFYQAAGTDCYLDRLLLVPTDGFIFTEDWRLASASFDALVDSEGIVVSAWHGGANAGKVYRSALDTAGWLRDYALEEWIRLVAVFQENLQGTAGVSMETSVQVWPRYHTL